MIDAIGREATQKLEQRLDDVVPYTSTRYDGGREYRPDDYRSGDDEPPDHCDWCGAVVTPLDSEDGLCARCARIAQEQDEQEFPVYVGSDGREHGEY